MLSENENFQYQASPKALYKNITLKKTKKSFTNHKILRRATTTRIDLEKTIYQSEVIWDEEKEKPEDEEVFKRKRISIFRLYYILLERIDYLYLVLGLIGCLAAGFSTPLVYYLNAEVYSDVGKTSEKRENMSEEEIMKQKVEDTLNSSIKKGFIFGSIALVDNFIGYFFIGILCTKALYNFKKIYFRLIFAQEQAWFDSINIFNFASKIQSQLETMETGLGDTLVDCIIKICSLIGALIFAFIGSWKLTLIILCLVPFMLISGILKILTAYKAGVLVMDVYQTAGSIAEEILYNIKIIVSFANFDYELKRFYEKTEISALLEKKLRFRQDFI